MKKSIIISLITVSILILTAFSYSQYNSKQQKEEYSKRLAKTALNLQIEFIMSSLIVANYSDVWSKAIDNGRDFNVVLAEYQDTISDRGVLKERENKQENIRNNMKLLQNPPEKYKSAYNDLKKMYGTYTKMTDQALSPTGSLIEFNRFTGQLASQFTEEKEQLDITLPADIKKIQKQMEKDTEKEKKNSL